MARSIAEVSPSSLPRAGGPQRWPRRRPQLSLCIWLMLAGAVAGLLPLLLALGPAGTVAFDFALPVLLGTLAMGAGVGAGVGWLAARQLGRSVTALRLAIDGPGRRLNPVALPRSEIVELAQLGDSISGLFAREAVRGASLAQTFAPPQADPALHQRVVAQRALEADLRLAIEQDQLELHFQPTVSASDLSARGVEALVRWRHPVRGLVYPADFIPLAEACGLIVPLGAWVLRCAVQQMRRWHDAGIAPDRIAVNLSACQLQQGTFADTVAQQLGEANLVPSCLELELTEGVVVEQSETSRDVVRQLRHLGVRLAIDDFGTGYSSLAYLARFPLSTLKIDRAFLVGIEQDGVNQAIISAVAMLAHRIGMRVVAEGVETAGQLTVARSLGCDEVQGYLMGRPLPAAEATVWLKAQQG